VGILFLIFISRENGNLYLLSLSNLKKQSDSQPAAALRGLPTPILTHLTTRFAQMKQCVVSPKFSKKIMYGVLIFSSRKNENFLGSKAAILKLPSRFTCLRVTDKDFLV